MVKLENIYWKNTDRFNYTQNTHSNMAPIFNSYFTTIRRVFDSGARFLSWTWFLLSSLVLRVLALAMQRSNRYKREPVEHTEGKSIDRVLHSRTPNVLLFLA